MGFGERGQHSKTAHCEIRKSKKGPCKRVLFFIWAVERFGVDYQRIFEVKIGQSFSSKALPGWDFPLPSHPNNFF
jgi:hypothetical protein